MSKIQAIAFDWGGIFTEGTFDSSAVENLAALCRVSEERIAATYYPVMEEFEVGAFDFHGFYERFTAHSGLTPDEGVFRKTFLSSVRERKAMFEVLAGIPQTYRVGMLSNNVSVLCDRVRDDARMSRVEHFVFSNEIGVRKPDPRAFEKLTGALGVPENATVFVDDNRANIEACERLGYQGVLLETFEGFTEAWRRLLPDIPVRTSPAQVRG